MKKDEDDLRRVSTIRAIKERTRRRLSHRSKAFRKLFLIGADTMVALLSEDQINEFGLGLEEPVFPIPAGVTFHDAFGEGNSEHWMNCWSMVALVVNSPLTAHKKLRIERHNIVVNLVPELTDEEWTRLRRHVLNQHGSDGYTPYIDKEWGKELTALRES